MKLKEWRVKRNLTQEEMGNKINCTYVSVSRYETAKRCNMRADTIEAIFEVTLGEIDANDLFGITPERIAEMKKRRKNNGKKEA